MTPLSLSEYRVLVERAPMMIWRSNTDEQCDYFNQLAFTGRTLRRRVYRRREGEGRLARGNSAQLTLLRNLAGRLLGAQDASKARIVATEGTAPGHGEAM